MNYSSLMDKIQQQIGTKPKQADLCRILGLSSSTIAQRSTRNSSFTEHEVDTIAQHYGIQLTHKTLTDFIHLDYFPDVYASCGHGSCVFDESSQKVPVSKDCIANYSPHNRYVMITARGNSMTPDIFDMDKVIIKQYTGSQIVDDKMYLFRYMDEIFIKKLCKNLDQVVVKSNNPDFPNRFIEGEKLKDMSIIGEVVGLVRTYN